jgi:YD repeat-containing protein
MGSPKKRIQYRFDSVGNRVGMTDPDGGRFTYAYLCSCQPD